MTVFGGEPIAAQPATPATVWAGLQGNPLATGANGSGLGGEQVSQAAMAEPIEAPATQTAFGHSQEGILVAANSADPQSGETSQPSIADRDEDSAAASGPSFREPAPTGSGTAVQNVSSAALAATTPDTGTGSAAAAPTPDTGTGSSQTAMPGGPTSAGPETPLPAVAPPSGPVNAEAPQPSGPVEPQQPTFNTVPAGGEQQPEQAVAPPIEEATLHYPVSVWPILAGESPLFGDEQISQFTEEEMLASKWSVRPHLSLSTVYDGNVFIKSQGAQGGFLADVGTGLTLRIGHPEATLFLIADYTVGAQLFFDHSSQDSLEQGATVSLTYSLTKLTLGFHAGLQSGSATSVDIGDRVQQTSFVAGLSASYPLTGKASITGDLTESLALFPAYIDSEETRLGGFYNYQVLDKVNIGVGGAVGYVAVQDAPGQVYEEASVRGIYSATAKVTVSANVGAQIRQFGAGEGGDITPVFGLGVSWAIRQGTDIEMSAQRSIFSSALFPGQDYAATGISLGIGQRLTDRYHLSFATGYQNQTYESAAADVNASRVDNYFYVRPGVAFSLTKWIGLNFFYEYSQNISTGEGAHSFERDRVGAQISLVF